MKAVIAFATILISATAAQEYYMEHGSDGYPVWYVRPDESQLRLRRDVTWEKKTSADGKIFGTLGQKDEDLYGKAGYEQNVFNDERGKMDASAYGTRVLSPYGDASKFGGALNWKDDRAAASLDISKQIHGRTTVEAAAGGRWPVGKNGDFTAQGTYSQTGGRKDYGGRAEYNYKW